MEVGGPGAGHRRAPPAHHGRARPSAKEYPVRLAAGCKPFASIEMRVRLDDPCDWNRLYDPKHVSYAFAWFSDEHTILEQAALDSATRLPTAAIADSLDEVDAAALLGLDAPRRWPAPLAEPLHIHRADQPLPGGSNTLVPRDIDRVVRNHIGK